MSDPCLLLVAVEPSGDELGAALAGALRQRLKGRVRFVGVGGAALREQGLVSAFDPSGMAVVGAFNALAAWPVARARARDVAALAVRERPDAAILIDAWGFSIRVAQRLREADPTLPLIKYVAPQVWATRPGRAKTLAKRVDRLLTIHSFDAPYFERQGLPTSFVGNPALARDFSGADPVAFRQTYGFRPDEPLLLILPGSRHGEVRRLMEPFGDAARRLCAERKELRVVVAAAPSVAAEVKASAAAWSISPLVLESEADRHSAMRAATAALACSGTVTTELALAGCPMVVGYRLDPLTYIAARLLLRTRYITLFNVAAGRLVARERLQGACRGDVLARDLAPLLNSPESRQAQSAAQAAALKIMRGGLADPVGAAAEAVLATLAERRA
jgi:lipid-A-disaccharide synthase